MHAAHPHSIQAYAKVNLLLAVQYPPVGGFHELRSVFQTVDLADELDFERVPRGELVEFRGAGAGDAAGGRLAFTEAGSAVVVECEPDVGIACADNLVFKAIDAMERACGRTLAGGADEAVRVRVKKRIPAGGGLGGGSSDAAAAIRWCAAELGIDACGPAALGVAGALGSDVACFLYGGATLMSGRGEHLERRLPAFPLPLVLMGDTHGNSTPAVYAAFDAGCAAALASSPAASPSPAAASPAGAPSPASASVPDAEALASLMERAAVSDAASAAALDAASPVAPLSLAAACANNLSEAAFSCNPALRARVERAQADPDVLAALVTGSGSTSFAICADETAAQRFAARAAAYSAWTRPVRAVCA